MTFKDVAYKNFKAQVRKYLSYFLCSSFSIMLFFMYSTLLFNKDIKVANNFDLVTFMFYLAMVNVGLFALFFINYAHTAFIRSRYKEFALYMTLGMTERDVQKILVLENLLIILSSIFVGLVSGSLFSRLFQIIVIKLLDLKGIAYHLDYKSFLVTFLVFVLIFACVMAFSRHLIGRLEIAELFKKSSHQEISSRHSLIPGLLGLLLIALSLILSYMIAKNKDLHTSMAALLSFVFISIAGVYASISSLGKSLLAALKRSPVLYYRNILSITEIYHRFNQNKNVIFVLSLLSSMIVFFVGAPFSLLSTAEKISGINQPNHLEYVEAANVNSIPAPQLQQLLENSKTPVKNQSSFEFLLLQFDESNDKYDSLHLKPVISQKLYNRMTGSNLIIPKGEIFNVITAWEPGHHGILPSSSIILKSGTHSFVFTVQGSVRSKWITGSETFPSSSGIVMNDQDYMEVKGKIPESALGNYHIANFENWKKTESVIQALRSALADGNFKRNIEDKRLVAALPLTSRLDSYNGLKQGYSLFIFVAAAMGLLFFVAAGSVLYFKQYTELGLIKAKFASLYRLGINSAEATSVISRELKLTFFTPLLFGSILGYSFMYLVTHLVGGEDVIKDFMLSATYVVVAYFIFQSLFYMRAKRKLAGDILHIML